MFFPHSNFKILISRAAVHITQCFSSLSNQKWKIFNAEISYFRSSAGKNHPISITHLFAPAEVLTTDVFLLVSRKWAFMWSGKSNLKAGEPSINYSWLEQKKHCMFLFREALNFWTTLWHGEAESRTVHTHSTVLLVIRENRLNMAQSF